MRSKIKSISPIRQPKADGADVVYRDGDYGAYSNGNCCGFFANSQDAWIAARAATFDAIEDDAVLTADILAAAADARLAVLEVA